MCATGTVLYGYGYLLAGSGDAWRFRGVQMAFPARRGSEATMPCLSFVLLPPSASPRNRRAGAGARRLPLLANGVWQAKKLAVTRRSGLPTEALLQ